MVHPPGERGEAYARGEINRLRGNLACEEEWTGDEMFRLMEPLLASAFFVGWSAAVEALSRGRR